MSLFKRNATAYFLAMHRNCRLISEYMLVIQDKLVLLKYKCLEHDVFITHDYIPLKESEEWSSIKTLLSTK